MVISLQRIEFFNRGKVKMKQSFIKFFLFVVFIIIFIISEALLIGQNLSLKNEIANYKNLQILLSQLKEKVEKINHERKYEGLDIPKFLLNHFDQYLMNDIINDFDSDYMLLFIFSIQDCPSCIRKQIQIMNEFFTSNISKNCPIIGYVEGTLKSAKQIKDSMKIDFQIIGVKDLTTQLLEHEINPTPVIFFVSRTKGRIIYSHFGTVLDDPVENFLNRVSKFAESND